jgi:hypothetical protein
MDRRHEWSVRMYHERLGEQRALIDERMVLVIRAAAPYVLVGAASVYLIYLILH